MRETRTGFAGEIRPEPEKGQVRRFPIVAGWDGGEPDDQVLVRHNGKNHVYPNPAALASAIRGAAEATAAATRIAQRRSAAQVREILITGVLIGLPLGLGVAKLLTRAFG